MTLTVDVVVGVTFPYLVMLTAVIGLVAVTLKAAFWAVRLYKELKRK